MKDREAWRAAVHGVAKSQTRLSDGTHTQTIAVRFSPSYCLRRREAWHALMGIFQCEVFRSH